MTTSRLSALIGILASMAFSLNSSAVESAADATKPAAIPQALQACIEKNEIAGAVTVVASKDKILSLDVVGMANVARQEPMKADSLFWIASMTKPVTATAIMMLQEEGKLSVDDPVGQYIPELSHLKTADGAEHVVTLHHLLTHSSGMAEPTKEEAKSAHTLAELIPFIASKPLLFVPGTKWQYCQSGLNTLGRVIEVRSGRSYPEFLQEKLFTPLGMSDTTFYPDRAHVARLATAYKLANGKLEESTTPFISGPDASARDHYPAANGGLFSTAADYARFLRMILNDGELDGVRYLKPQSVKLMTSVASGELATGFTPGDAWGLGWCVVREPQGITAMLSPGSFGHGGAYGTQAWVDPRKQLIYLLLVQRANFPNSDASDVRKAFQEAAAGAFAR